MIDRFLLSLPKKQSLDKSDDGCMSTNQSFNMDQSFCFQLPNTISPPIILLVQWKLDLADTNLAETLSLKDRLQKIWATISIFST